MNMLNDNLSSGGRASLSIPRNGLSTHGGLSPFCRGILFQALLLLPLASQAADWWSLPDDVFAQQFTKLALSDDTKDQSTVAWMLFARANQQQPTQGMTVSQWENWPSNEETFSPAMGLFAAAKKVRTRPHLQLSKADRMFQHSKTALSVPPSKGGEEVTRNMLSYNYIISKGLNSVDGVRAYLSAPSPKVDFPIGAVEVKADWVKQAVAGAYQFVDTKHKTTYSLVGLHIMAKMAPAPSDPFHSEEPSWFWTTFEFKGNDGLANAQKLVTYPDALPNADAMKLLAEAGLGSTAFTNYLCNGTQIRYSDAKNPSIILGNTTMEAFAGVPSGSPQNWKQWNSSCHTCHGEASASFSAQDTFFSFNVWIGKITDPSINAYTSLDFVWSIPFQAR